MRRVCNIPSYGLRGPTVSVTQRTRPCNVQSRPVLFGTLRKCCPGRASRIEKRVRKTVHALAVRIRGYTVFRAIEIEQNNNNNRTTAIRAAVKGLIMLAFS